jgi:hypothetical protein
MATTPKKPTSPTPEALKASNDSLTFMPSASPQKLAVYTNGQITGDDTDFSMKQAKPEESDTAEVIHQQAASTTPDPKNTIQQVNSEPFPDKPLQQIAVRDFDITYVTIIPRELQPITIRKATKKDIPRIVDIFTAAFWDEDAVGVYLHSNKTQFPNDVKKFWRRKLRMDWPTHTVMVAAISNENETEYGRIIGVANWEMVGRNGLGASKYFLPCCGHNQFRSVCRSRNLRLRNPREIQI